MRSSLITVVLCMLAQASAACESPTAAKQTHAAAAPAAAVATTSAITPTPVVAPAAPAAAARPGGELIKAAAASTHDGPPSAKSRDVSRVSDPDEHPQRGRTAMLLAALALMSGIALRRFGGPRE